MQGRARMHIEKERGKRLLSSVAVHGEAGPRGLLLSVSALSLYSAWGGSRAVIILYFTYAGTEAQRSDLTKVT